jgi:amino acid transporter
MSWGKGRERMNQDGARLPTLSVLQASAMLVGMVIGVFIFTAPTLVALNTTDPLVFVGLWLIGGLIALIGALCYAELATAYPDSGGEYHYLMRAYGEPVSFLFAWGRMTVIQTGAIAAVAFAYGKYAAVILPLGSMGDAIHAAIAVAALTGLQLLGTRESANTQAFLTTLEVLGLLFVATLGLILAGGATAVPVASTGKEEIGLAMVFIMLAYGGWNELSYVSGEMKDVRRTLAPVLLLGVLVVTVLYVLVNWALLSVFGLSGLRKTFTPVSDLVGQGFGEIGAVVAALMVCAMALSTINASIFTGGRTTLALGRSFALFGPLGRRDETIGTPVNAVLLQGSIILALVGIGSTTRNGFEYMVAYTAPVFWLFMVLVGIALFVLRRRDPGRERPFQVPLFPIIPVLWCVAALYMLYSSLRYIQNVLWTQTVWGDTGWGALFGLGVLALGVPVFLAGRGGRPVEAKHEGPG